MRDERTRKVIRKRSNAQENRTAKQYAGQRQPGSGNGWLRKNDVRADRFLIENKLTLGAKQITIKVADLMGVVNKAAREGRIGVLQFDVGGHEYIVLRNDDFRWMIDDD